jgi:sigma-E factor negative regulatory protein RseC
MAQEKGLVTSIREDGWARVVTDRRDACGDCRASHCCASFGSSSEMVIKALNRAGAGVGDLVSITLNSGTVIKGAAILYLIPVAGLMSGAIMGAGLSERLPFSETGAVTLLSFGGLILGFIITALISRRMSARGRLTPVITRIIKPALKAPEASMAIDPVCKMVVDPAEAPASFMYQDKNYYFCHRNCRESFMKDPESYL